MPKLSILRPGAILDIGDQKWQREESSASLSGKTHWVFVSPWGGASTLGMFVQSFDFIVPSYSATGYIRTPFSSSWIALRSSAVSSMKMRGPTRPVLVGERKTCVIPLGTSPSQFGPTVPQYSQERPDGIFGVVDVQPCWPDLDLHPLDGALRIIPTVDVRAARFRAAAIDGDVEPAVWHIFRHVGELDGIAAKTFAIVALVYGLAQLRWQILHIDPLRRQTDRWEWFRRDFRAPRRRLRLE
uniref:hypothetical protein n=1 Tax=Ensifer sp. Root423 TaxID=1736534 RepID=UPI001FCDF806|nr:hypothetical protein [Ensifer sp. Root423]